MKYYKTKSERKKQFLESQGVYPMKEEYDTAYYKCNAAFFALLETFEIRYNCFPNRFAR